MNSLLYILLFSAFFFGLINSNKSQGQKQESDYVDGLTRVRDLKERLERHEKEILEERITENAVESENVETNSQKEEEKGSSRSFFYEHIDRIGKIKEMLLEKENFRSTESTEQMDGGNDIKNEEIYNDGGDEDEYGEWGTHKQSNGMKDKIREIRSMGSLKKWVQKRMDNQDKTTQSDQGSSSQEGRKETSAEHAEQVNTKTTDEKLQEKTSSGDTIEELRKLIQKKRDEMEDSEEMKGKDEEIKVEDEEIKVEVLDEVKLRNEFQEKLKELDSNFEKLREKRPRSNQNDDLDSEDSFHGSHIEEKEGKLSSETEESEKKQEEKENELTSLKRLREMINNIKNSDEKIEVEDSQEYEIKNEKEDPKEEKDENMNMEVEFVTEEIENLVFVSNTDVNSEESKIFKDQLGEPHEVEEVEEGTYEIVEDFQGQDGEDYEQILEDTHDQGDEEEVEEEIEEEEIEEEEQKEEFFEETGQQEEHAKVEDFVFFEESKEMFVRPKKVLVHGIYPLIPEEIEREEDNKSFTHQQRSQPRFEKEENLPRESDICEPHYFCPDYRLPAIICPKGHHCDESGLTSPKPCPVGFYCPVDGLKEPRPCIRGYTCPSQGLMEMKICEPGNFCPRKKMTESAPCSPKYYCPDYGMSKRLPCKPGYYCPAPGLKEPFPCEPGHYCPGERLEEMIACGPGTTCKYWNLEKPSLCPIGYFCPETDIQEICPIGYLCDKPGLKAPKLCPTGKHCPVQGMREGKDTPERFFSPSKGNYEMIPCKRGFFCDKKGMSVMKPCPAGTFCPEDNSLRALPCPEGHYCPNPSQELPIPCPPGYFCKSKSTQHPKLCPKGSYCPNSHTLYPRKCLEGTYCPEKGMTKSLPCPKGHYCPSQKLSTPYPCPVGSYCPFEGLKRPLLCPYGYYCPMGRMRDPLECPVGIDCCDTGIGSLWSREIWIGIYDFGDEFNRFVNVTSKRIEKARNRWRWKMEVLTFRTNRTIESNVFYRYSFRATVGGFKILFMVMNLLIRCFRYIGNQVIRLQINRFWNLIVDYGSGLLKDVGRTWNNARDSFTESMNEN